MNNNCSVQIVLILAIALSVCGCVRRPLDTPADVPHVPKAVDFRMSVREPVTKGVPYGLDDKVEQLSFGISAYTSLPSGEGRNRYLEPTSIVFDAGSGKWSPAREILWPDQGGTVQFFAFGPYADGVMECPSDGLPVLHYSTPEDVAAQRGLLVYTSDPLPDYPEGNNGAVLRFTFRHVLSGIIFCIAEGMPIDSVTVSGVYDEGTYNYDGDCWTDLAATRSYTLAHPVVRPVEGFDVVEDSCLMLFPPQTCPEGAVIHLVSGDKTLDIPIAGHEWKEGYVQPYILGRSDYEYHFEAGEPEPLDWKGGEGDIVEIDSWRRGGDGGVESVPWVVEGYYASAEDAEAARNPLPAPFVTASVSGNPDVPGKSFLHVVYAPAEGIVKESSLEKAYNDSLAATPLRGSASAPWNLANPIDGGSGIIQSANTYKVFGSGFYRIPLIMGNGVSRISKRPETFSFENFKDYKDEAIVSPYLHESSAAAGTPTSAYVVWETSSLVEVANETSWKLSPAGHATGAVTYDNVGRLYWLHIHIPADTIRQGLVHLSVTDEQDLVMWSYLLWITPELRTESPSNLGWIEQGLLRETVYAEETVYVRLEQQKIGGKHLVVPVHRPGHTQMQTEHKGYCPYYQFGRKDPLIPATEAGDVAMLGCHPSFENTPSPVAVKATVGESIRTPWMHLSYVTSPYDWCADAGRDNWWLSSAGGKTIYDPCPAGYRVPGDTALEAMEGKEDFLLPCGRRNSKEGQLVNVGKYRYYWSATGVDEDSVRIFTDDPEMSGGLGRRSRALTIIPVTDIDFDNN